jgi:hypothetical protein
MQTAGCSFGGLHSMQPLSSGDTFISFSTLKRLSVLLPERSNCCNQRLCAFGGRLKGRLSPERVKF